MAQSGAGESVILFRYASALLDLAEEKKSLDAVSGDLTKIADYEKESEDFRRFLASPLIPKSQQKKIMEGIGEKAGFSPLTRNFLNVLVLNGRIRVLPAIITKFFDLKAERSGEVAIRIETAQPLSEEQKSGFQTKMSSVFGRKVKLDVSVDPSIIAGMVVTVGSVMIDDSVRRKLESLGTSLTKSANQNAEQNLKEVV
ncbi:MAG: F0F1 ATP synthase subunit delta [Alphaproteobacteria bacterium]|nr:F0F1 ATP synthase subunit delta [Alphaproteobacteria bacterium]MCB1839224.1 F0F1 ATP synthase subunit delta [Alphaproteobacteria bacterium]